MNQGEKRTYECRVLESSFKEGSHVIQGLNGRFLAGLSPGGDPTWNTEREAWHLNDEDLELAKEKLRDASDANWVLQPLEVVLHDENHPKSVEVPASDIKKHEDGTVTVFAWGYIFERCKLDWEPSDRFSPEIEYVIVEHPTGNFLKVWWPV